MRRTTRETKLQSRNQRSPNEDRRRRARKRRWWSRQAVDTRRSRGDGARPRGRGRLSRRRGRDRRPGRRDRGRPIARDWHQRQNDDRRHQQVPSGPGPQPRLPVASCPGQVDRRRPGREVLQHQLRSALRRGRRAARSADERVRRRSRGAPGGRATHQRRGIRSAARGRTRQRPDARGAHRVHDDAGQRRPRTVLLPIRQAGRPIGTPDTDTPRRRSMPSDQLDARAKGLALALLALTQFVIILDVSIVNVALPSIGAALDFSQDNLSWVVNAYTLTFGGFLLLGGRLADLMGRRRMFMSGLVLFTAASLLGGLAQSDVWLIAARTAQGLGAALVSPAALSLITTIFSEGAERNRALGVWGAVAGSGGAAGVLLGGMLTEWAGWEWVLFVNVPIGLAAVALAPRLLP